MTPAEIIKARLHELGIQQYRSLRGWCREHGLDYRATWRWMQDPERSTVTTARRICKALGITLDDLYRE